MPIVTLLLTIAVIGLIAWLIVTFIPMPPQFKTAIYVVAGVAVLFYLLQAFGLVGGLGSIRVPTVR